MSQKPALALWQWLFSIAFGLLSLQTLAAPKPVSADGCHYGPIQIFDEKQSYDLASCIWYLKDPTRKLDIDQVRSPKYGDDFVEHHQGVMNFGYTRSAYWIRFELDYRGEQPQRDWVLELALPLVDEADLYLYDGNQLREKRHTGYSVPIDKRDLAVPNPTFRLHLKKDEVTTIYLRIYTRNTFRLPLRLLSLEAYTHKVSIDEAIQGIFLGAMIAIFAYNLFVAISVRERGHWLYVAFLFFVTLFVLTEQVHGQQFFETRPAILDKRFLHLDILIAWFFGILMARDILSTREHAPGLDHILRLSLYAVIASTVLSFFISYHVAIKWTVYLSIFLAILMIVVSYRAWKAYDPSAWSYFFAWLFTFVGVGAYGITVIGYLPLDSITAHAPQIGVICEVVLLSFALADRIKTVQREALEWNQRAVSNLQRYRSLFSNAIEGIFQISRHRRFIDANPALADMLGYRNVKRLQRDVPDALAALFADADVRTDILEQLRADGTVKGVEALFITAGGEQRWGNISIRTVYFDNGDPSHLEGTVVDVTERKEREQIEKERENERLEKEIAKSSAESKSQFLANMSHEIRTPLGAIIGYGESLLDPELDDEEKRHSAETVVRSGRHLLDLINDILDHSKIDANKLDVEILTVNLPELLDEVRAFFAPRAREKGLDFAINCDYPLPETIQTDPTRFRQILINLCGNALKFTEKGSIQVAIRCDRDQEKIVARVIDTGIGMKPEQMARLFDPFAQGSAAIARQYGGTGLGLSISRRLAELLGGTIQVHSTYGEGSEFEVTIDSGTLDEVHFIRDASEMTQRRRQLPMIEAPRLHGRILCAEDNEVNRKLVDLLVSRTGATVVHVGNGAEALEAATRDTFDLILMDIQMPVMNGRDATEAIREAGVNTPIIALTANVMSEDIQDYRDAGCSDYLAKPIDKRRFYETLARYLTLDDGSETTGMATEQFSGTILVAEDNEDNQRLVERMLHRFGLNVIGVASGKEVVQRALGSTVHMILMDSHMPEMDGPDATRMLRQTGFMRPIIAFTAGDQQEIDLLRDAGCDGVLNKPIDQRQLLELLRKHLERRTDAEVEAEEDDAIQALIQQFVDGLAERQARMQRAMADEDWPALQVEAHQIKGTAGAMGFPLMTEKAGDLERALKNADWAAAHEYLEALERLIRHTLARRSSTPMH